ncbi:MAG TPA: adenosine deaminase [Candidatus Acidoferrales bacterium]|nr:adenosine deaminase [Candidatus Acidoferrales bacterium]
MVVAIGVLDSPQGVEARALIKALPKVQLHCHLEGTVRPAAFLALARKHGVDLGPRRGIELERLYDFTTFLEFLMLFRAVSETLRAPSDFAQIARDYIVEAAAQNVRYAELFISPSVWTYFQPDLDVRATLQAIRETLDDEGARYGMEVALIADLTRNFGPERALQTAQLVASMSAEFGIVGVGLGGDEVKWAPELFAQAFAYARERGLHCVAHAGEAMGASSVRGAVDVLGAERIGHGVRALEDPELVAELAERKIALEICPTSNRLTGAVSADIPHPIAEFDARGVVCVIDADDPALFGTSLVDEYLLVADWLGIEAVVRMARNAIEASFAAPAQKARLLAEFERARPPRKDC